MLKASKILLLSHSTSQLRSPCWLNRASFCYSILPLIALSAQWFEHDKVILFTGESEGPLGALESLIPANKTKQVKQYRWRTSTNFVFSVYGLVYFALLQHPYGISCYQEAFFPDFRKTIFL